MSIRDFVKKHKKKLIIASGILASLLAGAHLAERINRRQRQLILPRGPDPRWNPVIQDAPPEMIVPAEPIVRPRRYSDPIRIPAQPRERRPSEEEYKRPRARDGWGKNNSLLKAVQAYKKKHGCSLKEAWAAVRQ
jgi:hypothetical protein